MTVNPRQSFRLKLCLWIFTISIFAFVTVFGATLFYVRLETKRNIDIIVNSKLDYVTSTIDDKLTSTQVSAQNMLSIGQSPVIASVRDSIYPLFRYFLKYNPNVQGVAMGYEPQEGDNGKGFAPYTIQLDGKFIETDLAKEKDYRQSGWYKNTLATGQANWSPPFRDTDGRVNTSYNVPVRKPNGDIYAVLSVDLNLETIADTIRNLAPYPHANITVIDSNGTYVAHPNKSYIVNESMQSIAKKLGLPTNNDIARGIINQERGYGKFYNGEEDVYIYYAPIKKAHWTVTLEVPYSDLAGGYRRMFITMMIHSILGVVLLLVVSLVIIKKLTKPLETFATAAREISHGEFNVNLPVIKDHNELYDLRQALAAMEFSLNKYIEDLRKSTESKATIESELKTANHIQAAMVPKIFPPYPERKDIDIYATLIPAKAVGGDLYDFLLDGDDLYFCIGDVSGKGVPASLFMAITRSLFRNTCVHAKTPANIAKTLNHAITENNEESMFVTMFIGKCNLRTGAFTCCNCGHNAPVTNGTLTDPATMTISPCGTPSFMSVPPTNIPIGVIEGYDYQEVSMRLESGVKIFLYTDGITEAENRKCELFGDDRLLETLAATGIGQSAEKYVKDVVTEVHRYARGTEQSDDITILCLSYLGSPQKEDTKTPKRFSNMKYRLVINNRIEEMAQLEPFIEEVSEHFGIAPETVFQLNLALDEALANSVNYAYSAGSKGEIVLEASKEEGNVVFRLIDEGVPFDPTKEGSEPDVTSVAEDRPVGGLGIFLIKQMMDEITYERKDGRNILKMTKKL